MQAAQIDVSRKKASVRPPILPNWLKSPSRATPEASEAKTRGHHDKEQDAEEDLPYGVRDVGGEEVDKLLCAV